MMLSYLELLAAEYQVVYLGCHPYVKFPAMSMWTGYLLMKTSHHSAGTFCITPEGSKRLMAGVVLMEEKENSKL